MGWSVVTWDFFTHLPMRIKPLQQPRLSAKTKQDQASQNPGIVLRPHPTLRHYWQWMVAGKGQSLCIGFPCSSWMTCASGVSGLFKERKKRIRLGGMREVGEMSRYFFGYINGILQNKGKFTSKV